MNNDFFNPFIDNINLTYLKTNDNIKSKIYQAYVNDFKNIKVLPEKELKEKLKLYFKTKDINIRNEIVEHNLKLVISIAMTYINNGISFLDMVQEGNQGLIKAVEKFNPIKYHDIKFSTYAVWWIKQKITRSFKNNKNNIKIPLYLLDKLLTLKKICENHYKKHYKNPSLDELYNITNINKKTLEYYLYLLENLNNEQNLEEEIFSIEDKNPTNVIKNIFNHQIKKIILNILNDLINTKKIRKRDRDLFLMRTGINLEDIKTLKEVGNIYCLTRERVRQIEKKVKELLKNHKDFKKIEEIYKQI